MADCNINLQFGVLIRSNTKSGDGDSTLVEIGLSLGGGNPLHLILQVMDFQFTGYKKDIRSAGFVGS